MNVERFIDQRRLQLDVAGGEEHLAHVVGERVVERRALGEPECGAGRPGVEVAAVVIMAMGFSFLATLYPAFKAASTDPVQVLRYE